MGISALILLAVCGAVFCGMGILISKWIAPTSKNDAKLEAYECGVPTESGSWVQYNVGYYLFALIFLVFDVEIVFLFPWAVVLREVGMVVCVEKRCSQMGITQIASKYETARGGTNIRTTNVSYFVSSYSVRTSMK